MTQFILQSPFFTTEINEFTGLTKTIPFLLINIHSKNSLIKLLK